MSLTYICNLQNGTCFILRPLKALSRVVSSISLTHKFAECIEPHALVVLCRDMDVKDAIELGRRSIYHATFRDAVSGGTVSGAHICSGNTVHVKVAAWGVLG